MVKENRIVNILSILVAVVVIITASISIFWSNGGVPHEVQNIYGDSVMLYGDGIYANDSLFKAGILKGTDIVQLFICAPLLLLTVLLEKKSYHFRLLKVGLLGTVFYYAMSTAVGVSYNRLFILYVVMFSASLFAFILSLCGINADELSRKVKPNMPTKGLAIFMIFSGLSVFVWLFEIIQSLITGDPPKIIGIYTTEPTFIFDLGIIAPTAFTCAVFLWKKKSYGYVLLPILLTLLIAIGLIVVSQTFMQRAMGIMLSMGEKIGYVLSFACLSTIALIFEIKYFRCIEN